MVRERPSRADSAPRSPGPLGPRPGSPVPSRSILDRGFLDFLLILTGLTLLVAGLWNAPRRVVLQEQQEKVEALRREKQEIAEDLDVAWQLYRSALTDPRLRQRWLEKFFGIPADDAPTLREWIETKYRIPGS
jgi:hypothetical protein